MAAEQAFVLCVTLGPFSYEITTSGAWGADEAERLGAGLAVAEARPRLTRSCHLLPRALGQDDVLLSERGGLPEDLQELCARELPAAGWELALEPSDQASWWHAEWEVSFVTIGPAAPRTRYRLPWYPLFRDLLTLGGCIAHAGLAVLDGAGCLFAASAGGGKSTALRRLPEPWLVLADDAVVLWPEEEAWLGAPLPTWSYLLGAKPVRPEVEPCRTGLAVPVDHVFVLEKGDGEELAALRPEQAVMPIYKAAAEHPSVFDERRNFNPVLFAVAAAVARGVPSSVLTVTKDGEYWPLVEKAVR